MPPAAENNTSVPVTISTGTFKDVRSIVMENEALRLTIVPEFGAKIASLVHKKTGRECLDQLPGDRFRKAAYASPYDQGEVTGFDEMFPTISECYCDSGPWAGTKFPDHGEVWSLPWTCAISGSQVSTSVHGVRFPYEFTRMVTLERANTILLRYKVQNLSACDFPAMWAAHPLFTVSPGTRIILPQCAENIVNTVPGQALGDYGGRFTFPIARGSDGRQWDLSRVGPNEGKFYFKYFILDKLEEGFAVIHDPKSLETVAMVWSVDQVPYFGMWVNEGGWGGMYHAAPEPCTAPFDRWDTARQWGRLPVISAFGRQEWSLRLTVDLVEDPRRVEPDGTIS